MSVRSAAEAYGIAYSTLRDRLRGTQTRRAAHIKQQLITPRDEEAIILAIDRLERAGFPPCVDHFWQAAQKLNPHNTPPGKNWITRFLN